MGNISYIIPVTSKTFLINLSLGPTWNVIKPQKPARIPTSFGQEYTRALLQKREVQYRQSSRKNNT